MGHDYKKLQDEIKDDCGVSESSARLKERLASFDKSRARLDESLERHRENYARVDRAFTEYIAVLKEVRDGLKKSLDDIAEARAKIEEGGLSVTSIFGEKIRYDA